jgi:hypothetical protein
MEKNPKMGRKTHACYDIFLSISQHRRGSLMGVAREISKPKLHLVGVKEVRWDRGGTEPAGEYTFSYGKGNKNYELYTAFSYIRESYKLLRG